MSQLNLPHGTDNYKAEKKKTKKRKKDGMCSEVTVVKVWGIHIVNPEEEKERLQ